LRGGALSRVLNTRYLVLLGEASFSFYMFHQLVIRSIVLTGYGAGHPMRALALSLAIAVGLSILSYNVYEMPMRTAVRRVLSRA
jgi:peptidoglycan/LPS O-acetylase OafA/YrhL